MNSITDILDLEDSDIHVSNIQVEGTQKLITLEYNRYALSHPYRCQSHN